MTISVSNFNAQNYNTQNLSFKSKMHFLDKPIDTLSDTLEGTIDKLSPIPIDEKERKSHKVAIGASSAALVLTTLVFALNPKYSRTALNKLKTLGENASENIKKNKDSFLKTKFYQGLEGASKLSGKAMEFTGNFVSGKDTAYKWLCTEKKQFSFIKNNTIKNAFQWLDSGFVKVMKWQHDGITKVFDSLAKSTVKNKYYSANTALNRLDQQIQQAMLHLSDSEKQNVQHLFTEITKGRTALSEKALQQRFTNQENKLQGIEQEFTNKLRSIFGKVKDKQYGKEDAKNDFSFWAQEAVATKKSEIEKEGLDRISHLIGNGNDKKGLYEEIIEKLSPNISTEEKATLKELLAKASKKVKKANTCECSEYFDKKRDLTLGSAPTDIIGALFWLTVSGVLISNADTKEERMTTLISKAMPLVAGVFGSIALNSALVSGPVGIAAGFAMTYILSKMGSIASEKIYGDINKEKEIANA